MKIPTVDALPPNESFVHVIAVTITGEVTGPSITPDNDSVTAIAGRSSAGKDLSEALTFSLINSVPAGIGFYLTVMSMMPTDFVEMDKDVLVMTAPDDYVDNYNKTTAPRVTQYVSGDFTTEVTVLHVDPSKPNSVLERLGNFPVACHSGTLLIRRDDRNFVRFEHMNDMPKNLKAGVSMTSNTNPGCTVKFRDLKIESTGN